MNTSIIIALILGGAGMAPSIFYGYIPSHRRERIRQLKKTRDTLYSDLGLCYDLESELLDEIARVTGKTRRGLKDCTGVSFTRRITGAF
jgi:16S rRNA C1402 (ribose-2'-O) methylase RsmI